MGEYNPEWVIAVLEDLRDFCSHTQLHRSSSAIEQTLDVVISEVNLPISGANTVVDFADRKRNIC